MKKEKIFIFICLVLLSACSSSLDGIVIEKAETVINFPLTEEKPILKA